MIRQALIFRAESKVTSISSKNEENPATDAKPDIRKNKNYNLYISDSQKPLLERLCFCYPEFLINILISGDLQTLLTFRKISKALYILSSTKSPYYPFNPLFEKATVSFPYSIICPSLQPAVQEKWDFSQKAQLELQVITSSIFVDLPDLKPQPKLVLKSEAVNEFNHLQSLCSNPSNIKNKLFLDSLKIVDCSQIVIDANNLTLFNTFLTTIALNLPNLPNLKTLIIREVDPALSLQFPDLLNSLKIVFILNEEKSWLTLENTIKGLGIGLGIYGFYKYWFSEESKKEEKK